MDQNERAAGAYRKIQGLLKEVDKAQEANGDGAPATPAGTPPHRRGSRPGAGHRTAPAPAPGGPAPADHLRSTMSPDAADAALPGEEKLRQVAIFLALIGREEAGNVLRRMSREESDRILEIMATLPPISAQDARRVLARFGSESDAAVKAASHQALAGPETARAILIRAFGQEEGERRFYEILPEERPRRFAFFEDVDGKQLAGLLRKESSAVLAILVAHMPEKAAARLMNALEPERRVEVVRRVSALGRVDTLILTTIEDRLRTRVEALGTPEGEEVQGEERLAEILRYMDLGTGDKILTALGESNAELAEKVRTHLTSPDDLVYISDRDLQKILQRVDDQDIAVLLKGKRDAVVDRITKNLSERRREMVVMHREALGPMRRRDVDRVTTDFMRMVRTMAQEGEIVIRLPGDEYVGGPPL
jgi:flagellar motor switch protein FliG